jgi:hypothetical protein
LPINIFLRSQYIMKIVNFIIAHVLILLSCNLFSDLCGQVWWRKEYMIIMDIILMFGFNYSRHIIRCSKWLKDMKNLRSETSEDYTGIRIRRKFSWQAMIESMSVMRKDLSVDLHKTINQMSMQHHQQINCRVTYAFFTLVKSIHSTKKP